MAGLHELVADRLTVPGTAGSNAPAKVPTLVAGMVAGADSITDMRLLRHSGLGRLFSAARARQRWARSCGLTPLVTSVSSTCSSPVCWSDSPTRFRGSWPVPRKSPTSMSTTRSGGPMATPSKAPATATPGCGD